MFSIAETYRKTFVFVLQVCENIGKEELSNSAYEKDSTATADSERGNWRPAILGSNEVKVESTTLHKNINVWQRN